MAERPQGRTPVTSGRGRVPGRGVYTPKPKKKTVPQLNIDPAISGGLLDPKTGKPVVRDPIADAQNPKVQNQKFRERQEAIRRQNILKLNGYKIVVDGVWGPRSQEQWNRYMTKDGGGSVVNKPLVKKRNALNLQLADPKEQSPNQKSARMIKAENQQKILEARREAFKRDVQERTRIMSRAASLKTNPSLARNMKYHEISMVLNDRETNMDVTTNVGSRVFQEWAVGHGERIKVTGKWDTQTHDALVRIVKKKAAEQKAAHLYTIRHNLYRPAGLKGGDTVSWYPHGKLPTAVELDKMIQSGSYSDYRKVQLIMENAITPAVAFDSLRHAQLIGTARQLQPFGSTALSKFMGGDDNIPDYMLYADIMGMSDMAPLADLSSIPLAGTNGQGYFGSREWAAAQRAKNPEIVKENAKRLGRLYAETNALMRATDVKDFKRKLHAYLYVEDVKFNRLKKEIAGNEIGFFGKSIELIMAPGEFARTAAVLDVMKATQFLTGGGTRELTWEDALLVRGKDLSTPDIFGNSNPGYIAPNMESANGMLNFGFDVVADPLNAAHPFRVASSVLRYTSRAEMMGLRLGMATAGSYSRTAAGKAMFGTGYNSRLPFLTQRLVYTKGEWSLVSGLNKATFGIIQQSDAASHAKRLTVQARDKALDAARGRAAFHVRHGFLAKPALKIRQLKNKKTLALIEKHRPFIAEWLQKNPEFSGTIDDLKETFQAIYVNKDRNGELTQIGAALLAHHLELARLGAIKDIAVKRARAVVDLKIYADNAPTPGGGEWEAYLHEASLEATKVYDQIIADSGAHVATSAVDSALTKAERRALQKQIARATSLRRSILRDTIFPIVQDILDKHADDAFEAQKANPPRANVWEEVPGETLPPEGIIPPDEAIKEHPWLGHFSFYFKDDGRVIIGEPGEHHDEIMDRLGMTDVASWHQGTGIFEDGKVAALNPSWRADANVTMDNLDDPTLYATLSAEVKSSIYGHFHGLASEPGRRATASLRLGVKHPMWDEGDVFTGGTGGLSDRLSNLAKESFDDDAMPWIENPQFGHEWAWGDPSELIEHEIETKIGRLAWYASRRVESAAKEAFDFAGRAEKIRKEVLDHWHKDAKGNWTDDRDQIQVSDLYLRHREEAFARTTTGFDEDALTAEERIASFAAPPLQGAEIGTYYETWGLTWALGTIVPRNLAYDTAHLATNDPFTRIPWQPETEGMVSEAEVGLGSKEIAEAVQPDGSKFEYVTEGRGPMPDYIKDQLEEQIANWHSFQQAVTEHQLALSNGFDEMMPAELFKEGAMMQAFKHNESWPVKKAYNIIVGALNTWRFLTLPLRAGWMVRNIIDNVAKAFMAGVHDPRLWFLGAQNPGSGVHSIYDLGLRPMREMIAFCDKLFGTNALEGWRTLEDDFWNANADIIKSVLGAHGLPEVPTSVIEGSRRELFERAEPTKAWSQKPMYNESEIIREYETILETYGTERAAAYADSVGYKPESFWTKKYGMQKELDAEGNIVNGKSSHFESFREGVWDLMGNKPENYARRVIYIDRFRKAEKRMLEAGMKNEAEIGLKAHDEAWALVEKTLFDYSKVTVTEDNFRVFFPFIMFWRKNTALWVRNFVEHPWLDNAALQFDQARQEQHKDEPRWMQRYFSKEEVVDAAAIIPGFGAIAEALIPDGTQYDPMNLMSFAPFFRAYKEKVYGESQAVAPDEAGGPQDMRRIAILFSDFAQQWGLGLSPFARKPMEHLGLASEQSWQFMFPQTGPLVALTSKYINTEMGLTVADWERIFVLMQGDKPSDTIAQNYDRFVQQEIAGQAARGEKIDPERALRVIKGWFLTQNLYAYGTGMYLRRATPEDIYLSTLQNDLIFGKVDEEELSPEDARAIKLWRMRGMDRMTYNRYLDLMPIIEAYYKSPGWEDKQQLKVEHPEIIRWVDSKWRGKPYSGKLLQHGVQAVMSTRFSLALEFADNVDAPYAVKKSALDMFVTPDLEYYWKGANTPKDVRDHMVAMEAHNAYDKATKAYFEIPDTDYDAKDSFLEEHPEIVRYWNRNNSTYEDLDATWHGANAALRQTYFAIKDAKGWDGAAQFLKDHPYIFEDTKSAGKIKNGEWIGGGKWGKGKPMSAAHRAAWMKAKPHLAWFFDKYMKQVGEKKAWAWLESNDGPVAAMLKDYFQKWGKHSQKQVDYLRAKKWLTIFFNLPDDDKDAWLNSGSEGAKLVLAFFKKYGKGGGEHAKDYLAVKKEMDFYFSMSKAKRREWLKAGSPAALKVIAYFKKYGKAHQQERAFLKKHPGYAHGTPEQVKRLKFWTMYYQLTPDKRPAFVHENAEDFGIFIYGHFGDEERHDREQEYMRRAVDLGLKTAQAEYLYVKPLLDFMETLDKKDKALFMEANPEIQEYFDKHPSKGGAMSGNKKTDALIEQYFKLDPNSKARTQFLRLHPEVQDFFDSRGTPAEKAMHNLLEQYFTFEGDERESFAAKHPEIKAYFDLRRKQEELMSKQFNAFNDNDPRLAPYYKDAADIERAAAEMRDKLLRQSQDVISLAASSRGERQYDEKQYTRGR